jgi:hypothetical protein
VGKNFAVLDIFLWDIYRHPLHIFFQISILIFDTMLWASGIARVFNWLMCIGGIMHLKPTAGCQISTLIFENKLWRGFSINIPRKILKSVKDPGNIFILAKNGQELCRPWYIFHGIFIENPLHNLFSNIKVDIWHSAVGLRKPTAGCQISTLIFEKKLWRGVSMNIP